MKPSRDVVAPAGLQIVLGSGATAFTFAAHSAQDRHTMSVTPLQQNVTIAFAAPPKTALLRRRDREQDLRDIAVTTQISSSIRWRFTWKKAPPLTRYLVLLGAISDCRRAELRQRLRIHGSFVFEPPPRGKKRRPPISGNSRVSAAPAHQIHLAGLSSAKGPSQQILIAASANSSSSSTAGGNSTAKSSSRAITRLISGELMDSRTGRNSCEPNRK